MYTKQYFPIIPSYLVDLISLEDHDNSSHGDGYKIDRMDCTNYFSILTSRIRLDFESVLFDLVYELSYLRLSSLS